MMVKHRHTDAVGEKAEIHNLSLCLGISLPKAGQGFFCPVVLFHFPANTSLPENLI